MATITKRKDHWFVQVRLKDHKPIRKSFDTESKAIIWAANTETELKSGIYVDPTKFLIPHYQNALIAIDQKSLLRRRAPLKNLIELQCGRLMS